MTTQREYDLRRHQGLGKFSGGLVIDEVIYNISMDGCDEDLSHDGFGWWGMMQGPFSAEPMYLGDTELNEDEIAFLAEATGCIIHQSDSGFITVNFYDTAESLEKAWEETMREYGEDDGLDEDLEEHEEWPE